MAQQEEPSNSSTYPIGRGYGHDYMRGGEVLGGYGYSQRDEYVKRRGDLNDQVEGGGGGDAEDDEGEPSEGEKLPA